MDIAKDKRRGNTMDIHLILETYQYKFQLEVLFKPIKHFLWFFS